MDSMESYYIPRIGEDFYESMAKPYLKCYDTSGLTLQSEDMTKLSKSISIILELCHEYESEEYCAGIEETGEYFGTTDQLTIKVVLDLG